MPLKKYISLLLIFLKAVFSTKKKKSVGCFGIFGRLKKKSGSSDENTPTTDSQSLKNDNESESNSWKLADNLKSTAEKSKIKRLSVSNDLEISENEVTKTPDVNQTSSIESTSYIISTSHELAQYETSYES